MTIPLQPQCLILPLAWQGQGHHPRLTEEGMEAQSSLDLAQLEPALTLAVRCGELTA